MSVRSDEFALRPMRFEDLKGWGDDDPSSLFDAMRACYRHVTKAKPYKTGSLGLTTAELLPLLEAAQHVQPANAASARAFFETHCQPFLIRRTEDRSGFVTAFFEPEIDVSATPDAIYRFPFYRRPADLIDLDDGNRPAELDPSYMFARLQNGVVGPYPDRGEITRGYLEGKGLELAWAKSKVDVFFVHVQGAARLRYPDGRLGRITYAAKAGHPFSAVGRLLIDRGELARETISMQTIRDWLYDHPDEVDAVLSHNRSYIFFREAAVADPSSGPIAAAKVPLVAGRSLAVDRLIHTFGYPFFIRSVTLTHLDHGRPFQRLMLALDTGSAIVGPARGDIFTGSGYEAGELAGTVRHDADFHILVPKAAAARLSG
ncbi:MAG: murein transglycosylase A [Rhizobium sp.]